MSWVKRNGRYLLVAAVAVTVVVLLVAFVLPDWLWVPLGYCPGTPDQVRGCKGYNFHSGIGANFQELTMLAGIGVYLLKHNCYEHGCPRPGRVKGNDGHLRCKRDHKRTHPEYGQPSNGRPGVN